MQTKTVLMVGAAALLAAAVTIPATPANAAPGFGTAAAIRNGPAAADDLVVHAHVTTTKVAPGHVRYALSRTVGVPLVAGHGTVHTDTISSTSNCQDDTSDAVQICASITYDWYESGSFEYASMETVGNQANRLDNQAALNDLTWDVEATGECGRGCSGKPQHSYAGGQTSPTSNHSYTHPISWYGQYQRISANPFDQQGENVTLKWSFRGQSKTPVTMYLRLPNLA